ncbi:hypothetical protein [Roseivirga sp.]|uniref:hypothetical protein n=1 Tax=Roseivirga sp. TaxID=1964215 RepID=UPI003B8DCB34
MKRIHLPKLVLLLCVLLSSCGSGEDDDCLKTITIPQFYLVNNQSYSYDITQEVPCDFPDPETSQEIEPPILENFSFTVQSFNFTPDTGNNTSRLQFAIELNNPNDFPVEGIPIFNLLIDEVNITGNYSADASSPCNSLAANSSCTLIYDKESSLDLGVINSIEFVNLQYYLTQ